MLNNSKVLVTGSGGFIGSHLVEALIEAGADVKAFVKYNSRGDVGMLSSLEPEKFNKLEIVNGNITDPFFVKQAVKGCDYVFHLAALIGIPYSYIAPQDYVTTNVVGTLNVLQACLEMDVKRVIHTSTSEAYGTAQYVPIDELHPLQGQSPYSASKIGADKIVESYYKSFELPVVTVRPFNTFGPRQSARAFIPTAVTQVLTSDRIKMGSMYPVRDLTFVKDTVNGFLKVGMCDKALGEVVNLGVGHGDSIGDVVKTILKMLNKEDISIETDDKRVRPEKSEVLELVSNNRKAYDLCGWKPEYSLEKGLAETIEWIRQNLDIYKPSSYSI